MWHYKYANSLLRMCLVGLVTLFTLSAATQAFADPLSGAQNAPTRSIELVRTPSSDMGWGMILEKYLSPPDATGVARFDYGALAANETDHASLETYISKLEDTDPDTLSDPDAIAYWANLYNAVTVNLIVENYPVKSIRKIKSGMFSKGPWGKKLITVNGQRLSLDDVEHDILRKRYPSPLVHYMVNCASVGCPNLMAKPWNGETLDQDRDQAARDFINSARGVNITEQGLEISSIYKWFRKDFGGTRATVLEHIRQYANQELSNAIDAGAEISGHDYDWSLNDVD